MANRSEAVSRKAQYMREWREKNKDKWRAYMREWRAANKNRVREVYREWCNANREEVLEAKREWARKHRTEATRWRRQHPKLSREKARRQRAEVSEGRRQKKAEWALANPQKVAEAKQRHIDKNRARVARWKAENPELALATGKANLAKRRYPNTGHIDGALVLEVIRRSGGKCHWCGKEKLKGRDLTLEHLRPINAIEHLTIACYRCNASRRARSTQIASG